MAPCGRRFTLPLNYRDHLILTDGGEIAFDADHTRSEPSE
jgi:hypothetical protein